MIIYYAHCVALYNTVQETRDVQVLDHLFPAATLVNPNSPSIEKRCADLRTEVAGYNTAAVPCPRNEYPCSGYAPHTHPRDASAEIMTDIFKHLAQTCDLLVFRALPDGTIPAGVYKEITWAEEANVPILELPSAMLRRELTLPQTRQYLSEVGNR